MASENTEKGTSSIGGTGTSYNGPGDTGNSYGGGYDNTSDRQPTTKSVSSSRSILGALFGWGDDDAPASSDSTFSGATVAKDEKNYKTKYPQWRGVEKVASKVTGGIVPESFFDNLFHIESRGKQYASNKYGYKGLAQFGKATAAQYGLKNPYDPQQVAVAVGKLAKDNYNGLKKALGREPTQGELYLSHQQGLGGAKALLSHPNENVVTALARAYGGNTAKAARAVRANAGNVNMTARQFAEHWSVRDWEKYGGVQSLSGTGNPSRTAQRRGGSSVVQDRAYGDNSFIAALIGGNPTPVEVSDYIDSIKAGTIGTPRVDRELTTGSTTLTTDFTPKSMSGDTGDESITAKAGESSGLDKFTSVMRDLSNGDIGSALGTLGADIFGEDFFGPKIRTGIKAVDDLFGGTIGPDYDTPEGQTGNWIYEYFLRIIIIVLGLIFVAVGLSLFGRPIVNEVRKAVA